MRKKNTLGAWPFLVLAGQLVSGVRAKQNYDTLPEIMPCTDASAEQETSFPGISVIVPARNEAATLPRLLTSLLAQDYHPYEVLVVDDDSTDETAAIVQRYRDRGVELLSVAGPPPGWTGKNHACWIGATHARYSWLLFVDADTELAPSALHSTSCFVREHAISFVSLFARQRCETFWERLLLPFAYQQYFVSTDARVNNLSGPALANGQYLLIHSAVYHAVGGHAAIAGSIIDDVALAVRVKRAGIAAVACRGEQLVSVRMYTNLRQIVHGFGKNSFPYLQQSPLRGIQTALSTTFASAVGLLFIEAAWKKSSRLFALALLAYCAQVLNALLWLRHFGIHPRLALRYALLTPGAALVFLAIALSSLLHSITGRSVAWKGRSYKTRQYRHDLTVSNAVIQHHHERSPERVTVYDQ